VTTINEEVSVQNYLLSYLSADATLMTLINGVTLRTTWGTLKAPFVKIDRQDANDLMVVGLNRVWADFTFLIRGIDHWHGTGLPDWTKVGLIADRLDALLHDHEQVTSTLKVHSFREESFTDETVEAGDLWLHAGGIYRVRAQNLDSTDGVFTPGSYPNVAYPAP
jgi:hypothetical protein